MADSNITVAIVHGHRLYREALVLALAQQEGVRVSLEASGLSQILDAPPTSWPDLFLILSKSPLQECLVQVRELHVNMPTCKIIMLDVPNSTESILACIEIGGVSGYVLSDGSFDDVMRNIRAVAAGESVCSPRVMNVIFARMSALAHQTSRSLADRSQYLTRREQEIIEFIEKGLSNKEIASQLHIELSTVKNHVHNILEKLQLQDRRSAVRYVREKGLTAHFS